MKKIQTETETIVICERARVKSNEMFQILTGN